jgi:hypothetical protein
MKVYFYDLKENLIKINYQFLSDKEIAEIYEAENCEAEAPDVADWVKKMPRRSVIGNVIQ